MLSGFTIVLQSDALLPIHTLKTTGPCSQWCPLSNWRCLSVTLLIVDPWQSCVYFIRSGVTRCTFLTVLYLDHMCTRGALVAQGCTYARPRCRTSQYSRTFIPLSVSLRNYLANPVFDGVGLAGFKSRANGVLFA